MKEKEKETMRIRYYPKISFIVFISSLILSAVTICRAEEITLTTYYPSPYGVYSEMRLYPKLASTTPCVTGNPNSQPGVMFYDSDDRTLKVCVETSPGVYDWQRLGGGFWAASPPPNTNDIYNTNLGNVGIGTQNTLGLRLYLNANVPTPAGRNGMQISTPLSHYVGLGGGIGTDGSNTAGLHIGNQAGLNYGGEGGTFYYDYDPADRALVAASTGGIRIAALGQYPPAGRDIIFSTNPSNIERMRITDGGSVGIGTTNPDHRLVVGPAGGGRHLVINDIAGARWGLATGNYDLAFQNDNGGTWNTRMIITEVGSVGIGTTNPGVKLHVMGNMGCQFPGGAPYGDYFLVNQEAGRPVVRITDDGSYNPVLQFGKGSSWMNLEYTGSTLNIGGNTGSNVSAYDYWIGASSSWASSFSDIRLKEKIQPITGVLERLRAIKCVSFNWNEAYAALGHPNNKRQIGVIAQDVEQSFPELVISSEEGGYKSVNYDGVTAVLLEAIKEQQAEIESLETRIETLEKR